jgi:hypothetical protein
MRIHDTLIPLVSWLLVSRIPHQIRRKGEGAFERQLPREPATDEAKYFAWLRRNRGEKKKRKEEKKRQGTRNKKSPVSLGRVLIKVES